MSDPQSFADLVLGVAVIKLVLGRVRPSSWRQYWLLHLATDAAILVLGTIGCVLEWGLWAAPVYVGVVLCLIWWREVGPWWKRRQMADD